MHPINHKIGLVFAIGLFLIQKTKFAPASLKACGQLHTILNNYLRQIRADTCTPRLGRKIRIRLLSRIESGIPPNGQARNNYASIIWAIFSTFCCGVNYKKLCVFPMLNAEHSFKPRTVQYHLNGGGGGVPGGGGGIGVADLAGGVWNASLLNCPDTGTRWPLPYIHWM